MEPRPYQIDAIAGLRLGIQQGHRNQLLQAATGSGKTFMAGCMIQGAESRGKRTLFCADSLELVDQALTTFDGMGLEVGVMQGNHYRTDESCLTQVCTPHTLAKRLIKDADKFEHYPVHMVFQDEAHVQYGVRDKLAKLYPNAFNFGLSATPFAKKLGSFYTNMVSAIPMQELIDTGNLCKYRVLGPSKPDMKGVGKNVAGDFKEEESAKKYDKKLVADIVQTWLQHGKGKPTLGFACDVAHSREMSAAFKAAGINSEHIDGYGSTKEDKQARKDVIERFKRGEIDVLWNCLVLTKGFDAPRTECLIIARPTQSMSIHFQIVGRLLRPFDGKDALILDHAGNFDRLMFPEQFDFTNFIMDDGSIEAKEAADKIRDEVAPPSKCSACGYSQPTFFSKCPQCGSDRVRQVRAKEVLIEEGVLVEKKKDPVISTAQKAEFFGGLLHYANSKGYSSGWAYHKFIEKYKHKPQGYAKILVPPNAEVLGWMQHQRIKYAKGKNK